MFKAGCTTSHGGCTNIHSLKISKKRFLTRSRDNKGNMEQGEESCAQKRECFRADELQRK